MNLDGISGISGIYGNQKQDQQTVTIKGQTFTLSGDPDTDAQTVADSLNISVEEAKSELKAQLGDPQKPNGESTSKSYNNPATWGNAFLGSNYCE